MSGTVRPSGHLQVVDPGSGRRWHALWRDAYGRHQKILGPAWVKDSGKRTPRGAIAWRAANGPKPDPSYLTPADAEDRLRTILAGAPRAAANGERRRGPLFAAVAAEWLEHGEHKRGLKHSTLTDYRYLLRNHLLPAFGERPVRAITRQEIERWHSGYERTRTAGQALMVLGAILRYAQRREFITTNPIDGVERHPVRYSGDYDMYSREEINAIVRCAADDQDAAIILTAALTGMRRGELLALHWRDIDSPPKRSASGPTSPTASSPLRNRARFGSCRWSTRSPGSSQGSPPASGRPATRTPSSPHRSAATSTQARCAAASSTPSTVPACAPPVPLAAPLLRLDGRQQGLARAGPGLDGPRPHPKPPPATCTIAPNTATRHSLPTPSGLPRQPRPLVASPRSSRAAQARMNAALRRNGVRFRTPNQALDVSHNRCRV